MRTGGETPPPLDHKRGIMAFGRNPGALFIGTLTPSDKAFIFSLLKAAKKNGYERVVEPCSGQLAMSCLAAEAGFANIEASDVTLFSGVLGRCIEGRSLDDMNIRYKDGSDVPKNPEEIMYEIKHRELISQAGSAYGLEMLKDFEKRKAEIVCSIKSTLEELKKKIPCIKYQDADMFEHIRQVKDDEKTLILCMCPTYRGGYERFYKAIDDSTYWNEPWYDVFEPPQGFKMLLDETKDSKCLLVIYEEVEAGNPIGEPIYGRKGGRKGENMYFVSNDLQRAESLIGSSCARKDALKLSPIKYPLMPKDHEITESSSIAVIKAAPEHIRYYRKLFTHNFTPSASSSGYALIIDGYLAGIFGYVVIANKLGGNCEDAYIGFGMTTKTKYRLNRLLYKIAVQRKTVAQEFTDIEVETISRIKTVMITKYPESKEMRGIMKLVGKESDARMGFKLTYGCDIEEKEYDQVIAEFLQKERKWQMGKTK